MAVIFTLSSLPGSGGDFSPPLWYILERKGAHVAEFFILAFLAASFLSTYDFFQKKRLLFFCFVVLFCVSYAFSDELHQSFVFGRGARFTDVLIDTGGALLGASVFFFWKKR